MSRVLRRQLEREAALTVEIPEVPKPHLDHEQAVTLPQEGPLELSVEQAIMFSLKNNRDLQVTQINPVIAGTFEQIERGVFDPEVFVELEYFKERAIEASRSTETQFSVEGSDTYAVAGIRQMLPTGTEVEATLEQARTDSNRTPRQNSARLGLSITQSLLKRIWTSSESR